MHQQCVHRAQHLPAHSTAQQGSAQHRAYNNLNNWNRWHAHGGMLFQIRRITSKNNAFGSYTQGHDILPPRLQAGGAYCQTKPLTSCPCSMPCLPEMPQTKHSLCVAKQGCIYPMHPCMHADVTHILALARAAAHASVATCLASSAATASWPKLRKAGVKAMSVPCSLRTLRDTPAGRGHHACTRPHPQ